MKRYIYLIQILLLPSTLLSTESINKVFRESYRMTQEKVLQKMGPVIIVKADTLILHYQGKREEIRYMPAVYHQLKEIDHIPLAIMIFARHLEIPKDFKGRIKALRDHLDFPDAYVENQRSILDRCLEFLDTSNKDVLPFCRELAPLLLKNAEEAAFIQLDALHRQAQKWKAKIPQDEWNRLAAIVIGPQMPRVGEVTLQYFARLTGKSLNERQILPSWISCIEVDSAKASKVNRRLVYAENLWDEQEALKLLATHIIDEEIGFVFFDDKQRMFYDLLSEGASKRLEDQCQNKD